MIMFNKSVTFQKIAKNSFYALLDRKSSPSHVTLQCDNGQ